MVAERYWPHVGGVERHVERVCEILLDRGYHVSIICGAAAGRPSEDSHKGVEIHRLPRRWDRVPLLATVWMLLHRRLWRHADIIHVHDMYPLLFWCLPIVLLRGRGGVWATFHGYERDPIPALFVILRRIARRLVRAVICVGSFIEECYGVQCDLTTIGATDPVPEPLPSDTRDSIIFIGQLRRDIGPDVYVEAAGILWREWGMAQTMIVVGEGEAEEEMRRQAEFWDIDVRFMGTVVDPSPLLRRALFCLAGGYLSILEAMAHGVPVIGFADTPLRYRYLMAVREAGGPISIQTSAEGIAQEMGRLMGRPPEYYEYLVDASRRFAARYTWGALADMYVKLWSPG